MNSYRNIYVLVFMASVIFLLACKKKGSYCPDYQDEHNKLHEETAQKVLYTGHDTLRFSHLIDSVIVDTIVWVGQGKVYGDQLINWQRKGPEGCGYNIYGQNISTIYKANKPGYDMKFNIVAKNWSDYYYIDLLQFEFEEAIGVINDGSAGAYYPQKEINGKLYYDVNYDFQTSYNKQFYLYYTVNKGIIRIELYNKHHVFELLD